jgi:hypothetical protein
VCDAVGDFSLGRFQRGLGCCGFCRFEVGEILESAFRVPCAP